MTVASRATSAGGPSRDDPALRQHTDVLAQAHHRLHHVLDHQDRDAARRGCARTTGIDVADLGRVQAGQHLVEQQQPRLGRERAGELQPLAAGDRQARGRLVELGGRGRRGAATSSAAASAVARAARVADARRRRCSRARSGPRRAARSGRCARCRGARAMCGARPVMSCALETARAARSALEAGDQREQRRLAGAVRADQRR